MKIDTSSSLLILVDSLRIGGIERNALDQLYQLSDEGIDSTLIVMSKEATDKNPNFLSAEKDIVSRKSLDIMFAPKGIIKQVVFFKKLICAKKPTLILDYTISRTPLLKLSLLLARKKVPVHCVIQQFPSLSATPQRIKRMFYAQFATRLFFNSVNYRDEWDFYRKKFLYSLMFRKKYSIIRNGVYLPRVNSASKIEEKVEVDVPRFIFLGRLKQWKGLVNLEYIDFAMHHKCKFLVLTPGPDYSVAEELQKRFGGRIEFEYGKTLSDFIPQENDIHVYPVDYGANSKFVESISTNCLEMAMIGIPSMVTKGGTRNWPELERLGLVIQVDWRDEESVRKVVAQSRKIVVSEKSFLVLSQQVSIYSNLQKHISLSMN